MHAAKTHSRWLKKYEVGGFPGCAVVRTLCIHCRGHGFKPWSGNEDPTCPVLWQKKKKYEVYSQKKGAMRRLLEPGRRGACDSPSPPASGTPAWLPSSHLLCCSCTGSLSTCGSFFDPHSGLRGAAAAMGPLWPRQGVHPTRQSWKIGEKDRFG